METFERTRNKTSQEKDSIIEGCVNLEDKIFGYTDKARDLRIAYLREFDLEYLKRRLTDLKKFIGDRFE